MERSREKKAHEEEGKEQTCFISCVKKHYASGNCGSAIENIRIQTGQKRPRYSAFFRCRAEAICYMAIKGNPRAHAERKTYSARAQASMKRRPPRAQVHCKIFECSGSDGQKDLKAAFSRRL
jgi:hypothetical protein